MLPSRVSVIRWAWPLFAILFVAACAKPEDGAQPENDEGPRDALAVIERSADALSQLTSVAHDFTWGDPDNPAGWVTGRTWTRRVTDVGDSWLRVEGTVHAQPSFAVEEADFAFMVDGDRAWALDSGTWKTAPVGDGANTLSATAVLGYLPEFIEARQVGAGVHAASESVVVAVALAEAVDSMRYTR